MARGTMKLLDPSSGLMECRVCGSRHLANRAIGGHYYRGSWQCNDRELHPEPFQQSEAERCEPAENGLAP